MNRMSNMNASEKNSALSHEAAEVSPVENGERKEKVTVSRRRALGLTAGVAAASLIPSRMLLAQDHHGDVVANATAAGQGDWQPEFFAPEDMPTVIALADLIIPRTDTPGALDAGVPRYIDKAMAAEKDFYKKRLRKGLVEFQEYCQTTHGGRFHDLTAEQQLAVLESASDKQEKVTGDARKANKFFVDFKTRVLDGYYTSYEGLVEDLSRTTKMMFQRYRGCTHRGDTHT